MFNQNNTNHCNTRNHPNGFTIAEMTIVIAIMAFLGVIGTRTFLDERDRFEFNNSLVKILQLVKTVRTYATTSYPIYVDRGGFKGNIIPLDGYGIKAELDNVTKQFSLTVFANVGSGSDLASIQKDDVPNVFDESDIVLETYTLPRQIAFRYFYFDGLKKWKTQTETEPAGPNALKATLIFRPPLGDMSITGENEDTSLADLNELGIQFENPSTDASGPKKCQKIIINKVKVFPELNYEPAC